MTALRALRAAARRNTAIFAKCWRLNVDSAAHQYDMAARVDGDSPYQADFWPRDHGKSEIFCISYPLRRICEDPNLRILIVQKTATEAEKTLSVIKTELESNGALKSYYAPHWESTVGHRDISNAAGQVLFAGRKEGAWQQRRIYVKRSRRGKDPTVEAVGVGGAITGGHFDVIILDDVEDDENTRTDDRLRALLNWFTGTIMQLREPHTKIVIVGTFKTSRRDIYNTVLENPIWDCQVVSAITSHELESLEWEPVKNEAGRIVDVEIRTPEVQTLWPQVWDLRALLLELLASPDPVVWGREKLNKLSQAGRIFNRDDFGYYTQADVVEIEKRGGFESLIQVWDTSFGEGKSDWTACMTAGLHQGRVYLLDLFRLRITTPDIIADVEAQFRAWHPHEICVEAVSGGLAIVQVLEQQTNLPITRLSPGGKSKVDRARGATVYLRNGRVLLRDGASWVPGLLAEVGQFPDVDNDDRVDVMVYAVMYLLLEEYGEYADATAY